MELRPSIQAGSEWIFWWAERHEKTFRNQWINPPNPHGFFNNLYIFWCMIELVVLISMYVATEEPVSWFKELSSFQGSFVYFFI